MLSARQMAGWKGKTNNSSITESELWRKEVLSVAGDYVEKVTKYDRHILYRPISVRTF